MYIKHDYNYKELKRFIAPCNMETYEEIEKAGMQDVFCLMVGEYFEYNAPTVEALNDYMFLHKEHIMQKLKEWA